MGYPSRFCHFPLLLPYDEEVLAQRDTTKWENQRFTIGNPLCRLIGLRLYRFFRNFPITEPCKFEKQELVDAVFTRREQMEGASVPNVGRHLVNAVTYQPVFQQRRAGDKKMCWRFHSPRDVEHGVANQIGVWIVDYLIQNADLQVPVPPNLLINELDGIYDCSEEELRDLWLG